MSLIRNYCSVSPTRLHEPADYPEAWDNIMVVADKRKPHVRVLLHICKHCSGIFGIPTTRPGN